MLNAYTTLNNIAERLCKSRSKQNLSNSTMRMHWRNIQKCCISIHSRNALSKSTLAHFFSTICGFSMVKYIPRKIWKNAVRFEWNFILIVVLPTVVRLFHHLRAGFLKEVHTFFIQRLYRLCQISVMEFWLRFPVGSKYNSGCKRVCSIINSHLC